MRTFFLVFLLLTLPFPAAAIEDIPLDVSRIDISSERGTHNSVIASARDSEGYLWFASLRGLNVYDGHTVRPVLEDVLQGNNLNDIHIDSRDTLWVAANTGIVAYSLKTGEHTWYRFDSDGMPLDSNRVVFEDKRGTIFVGSFKKRSAASAGFLRYEPSFDRFEKIKVFDPASQKVYAVHDICEDLDRNLWLATNHGVCRLTGSQGPAVFIPLATPKAYSAKHITFDDAGTLWLSAGSDGLWKLPRRAPKLELQAVPDGSDWHINDMYSDLEGDVWFSTTIGLFRYANHEDRMYRHPCLYPEKSSAQKDFMGAVLETTSRTFWIGTYSNGVLRYMAYAGARIVNLLSPGQTDGKNLSDIRHLATAPDSRIYFAPAGGGVYRTAPVTANRILFSPELEVEPVITDLKIKSMAWAPDNALLCGLDDGLLRIGPLGERQRITTFNKQKNLALEDKDIEFICPMQDGRIWFSTKFDLYSWSPEEPEARFERRMPGQEPIASLTQQGSSLWIAHGSKISEIDTLSGRWFPVSYDPSPAAQHSKIKSLRLEGDTVLWVGTLNNTFRYNRKTGQTTTILTSGQQSLKVALSFYPDDSGNVWIHTLEKLYRIAPGATFAVEEILGANHPSVSISSPPVPLGDKAMVYGHTEGLLPVIPHRLLARETPVPKISEVRIFGKPLEPNPLGRMPANLELGHEQNYLTFTFAIPEPQALHPPRFQYFLEGVDSTWNDSGDQTSISYAHLEPGQYVLHVKDGPEGKAIASMSIRIHAPWWLTPWAKAGYALAALLGGLFAVRAATRLQTTRIRKEMLENLVMQDPLTEIPNRRKFKEVLAAEKSRCKRSNHQISVLMIDIDFFKGFNDRFGHQAGDKALRIVAQTVSSTLKRPEDFVARFGGEEFVVVLPSTNRAGAERVAQKIQDAVYHAEIPYPGSPLSDRVTLSIGISTFSPQTDLHIDSGLFSADQALYQAKRNGRNCVFYKDHCLALTPVRQ